MSSSLWLQALAALSEKERTIFQINGTEPPLDCLHDIISKVEKQRNRCKYGRWKVHGLRGEELVARDVCAKIAACVKRFIQVGDAAVQYDPAHAALPWAGLRFLLQLSLDSFETFDAVAEGLGKVANIIARYSTVEMLYRPADTEAKKVLEAGHLKLYVAVLRFLCEAKKYFDKNRASRVLTSVVKRMDVDDAHRNIIELDTQFQAQKLVVDGENIASIQTDVTGIQASQEQLRNTLQALEVPAMRATDEIADLHVALKETERINLLNWLSAVPIGGYHRAILATIGPQVGQWLLADVLAVSWHA